MMALQDWGLRWAELKPEHAHPGVVLWSWVTGYLHRDRLPRRRVLVRFDFAIRGPGRRCWVLIERGDAEICEKNPGFDEDVIVTVSDPVAFARWHLREIEWGDALRSGAIHIAGPKELTRAFPTWVGSARPFDRNAS